MRPDEEAEKINFMNKVINRNLSADEVESLIRRIAAIQLSPTTFYGTNKAYIRTDHPDADFQRERHLSEEAYRIGHELIKASKWYVSNSWPPRNSDVPEYDIDDNSEMKIRDWLDHIMESSRKYREMMS